MANKTPVAIIPASSDANVYNYERARMRVLAIALKAVDPRSVILDGDDPGFSRQLFSRLAQGDHAFFAGCFGYDLTAEASHVMAKANLFDLFDSPVVGYLADHPFNNFMLHRLRNAAKRSALLVMDSDFIAEAKAVNPALRHFRHVATPCFMADLPAPVVQRDIDIFAPIDPVKVHHGLADIRGWAATMAPEAGPLTDELYDALKHRGGETIWSVFSRLCERRFQAPPIQGQLPDNMLTAALIALGRLDQMLRRDARIAVFHRLVEASRWAKVALTIPTGRVELPKWSRMQVIPGTIAAEEMTSWYARARFSLNVSPYDNEVNARVTSGIAHGSVPVSDWRPGLSGFTHGRDILFLDRLGNGLEGLRDLSDDDLARMNQAGRQRLPEFSPRRFAETLCAVFDELG